ncbi:ABC transporter ATP-binding protein [Flammeovirga sp. EKP202]|uniref:ABC transporter ATP-binding protein n=1 Tax=Flammeovirga sp. EKP202 TaxID=2770592 RepID=UPI00165F978C|nr:ABC transporter ATP-binding protein [Flammeovirga sp. EKP202]MBD0401662.1 ABC transporter ATP-binding protein [Flammeovirga sp. EKP202]
MKTYKRLLTYAGSLSGFLIPYFFVTVLVSVFSLANFGLAIPLLDMLFTSEESFKVNGVLLELKNFDGSIEFLKDYFYQEFGLLMNENGKLYALMMICLVTVGASLLTNIMRYVEKMIAENFRVNTISHLRTSVFKKVLTLDIGYLTDKKKSDIIARSTTDMTETENSLASVITFIKDPVALIIFFVSLIMLSYQMTLFVFLILPISGGMIALISKSLRKKTHSLQEKNGELLGVLDESIVGMRVVKGFNAEPYVNKAFKKHNDDYVNTFFKVVRRIELASPTSEVLGVFFIGVLLYYGGVLVLGEDPTLSASQFLAYLGIFTQVLNPVKSLTGNISRIQRGVAATERIFELIDTKPEIVNKADAKELKSFEKNIELEDVRFSYGDKEVIHGINFSIEKGQTVALVGGSGGGKSTIADFIPRFYDVQKGAVKIDGLNIKDYTLSSLRSHMGVVTQESILFNDTVYSNIAFGMDSITEEDVIKAAKIANAHDFIMALEDGYQTVIGDRGSRLSGGQRQRLSIARAVVSNPDILILDEATSALDTESEKLVQDAIQHLMKGRTSLVIAHRLSTIMEADKIVVINKGKIVEEGTHKELIAKEGGEYRKLQELQGYDR